MKVLLDENIDVRLKRFFDNSGHEVFTVKDMNWNGVKNGALLKLLEENNFEIFIAVDKNLPYQQNLQNLPVTIFILNVYRNILTHVQEYVPILLEMMQKELPKEVIVLKI